MAETTPDRFEKVVQAIDKLAGLYYDRLEFVADGLVKIRQELAHISQVLTSRLTKIQSQRKGEKPVSATKSIPQVNEELEALKKLLGHLELQVENLGTSLPGKVKEACERYQELLFDQLPLDAPEQDVELAERNLQLLAPMVQMTKEVADQCQRYKDDLKGYEALGTLEHVRVMYNAGTVAEKQRERVATKMRELRESKQQLTEERDRARKTLGLVTQHAEKLLAERDRARKTLGQLTAQLAATKQTA